MSRGIRESVEEGSGISCPERHLCVIIYYNL